MLKPRWSVRVLWDSRWLKVDEHFTLSSARARALRRLVDVPRVRVAIFDGPTLRREVRAGRNARTVTADRHTCLM